MILPFIKTLLPLLSIRIYKTLQYRKQNVEAVCTARTKSARMLQQEFKQQTYYNVLASNQTGFSALKRVEALVSLNTCKNPQR
jgi:hypothetical protein